LWSSVLKCRRFWAKRRSSAGSTTAWAIEDVLSTDGPAVQPGGEEWRFPEAGLVIAPRNEASRSVPA